MAAIDKVSREDLLKLQKLLEKDHRPGKGKEIKALCEKYEVNDWYFYRNKGKITDLLNGHEGMAPTVTGTSTLLDAEGNVKLQWIKEKSNDSMAAFEEAVNEICGKIPKMYTPVMLRETTQLEQKLTVYISNDVHLGALMWQEETKDRDWDLDIANAVFREAIDNLVARAPATKECIVADLGDLTEIDDMSNMTPRGKNILDTDGRYPKVMRVAMEALVYFVEKALEKHEIVRFYNISGNHDVTTGYAIGAFVAAWFKNEPRVIVDESPAKQKYYQFGSTLLGFAHGDGLKMKDSGEVMAMHNATIWGSTANRYYHFGHIHKDAVYDGRLCKAESHRNLAPLNAWASDAGFGRNAGTMKAIVYDYKRGEDLRITYNVEVEND